VPIVDSAKKYHGHQLPCVGDRVDPVQQTRWCRALSLVSNNEEACVSSPPEWALAGVATGMKSQDERCPATHPIHCVPGWHNKRNGFGLAEVAQNVHSAFALIFDGACGL
jgi:hypothetical protein